MKYKATSKVEPTQDSFLIEFVVCYCSYMKRLSLIYCTAVNYFFIFLFFNIRATRQLISHQPLPSLCLYWSQILLLQQQMMQCLLQLHPLPSQLEGGNRKPQKLHPWVTLIQNCQEEEMKAISYLQFLLPTLINKCKFFRLRTCQYIVVKIKQSFCK